jgi:hypothetical protein
MPRSAPPPPRWSSSACRITATVIGRASSSREEAACSWRAPPRARRRRPAGPHRRNLARAPAWPPRCARRAAPAAAGARADRRNDQGHAAGVRRLGRRRPSLGNRTRWTARMPTTPARSPSTTPPAATCRTTRAAPTAACTSSRSCSGCAGRQRLVRHSRRHGKRALFHGAVSLSDQRQGRADGLAGRADRRRRRIQGHGQRRLHADPPGRHPGAG